LYLPGIGWGLPGTVSWSQDTIAGTRTLGAVAQWPQEWKGRYPPLHYLILRAAYTPVLRHWDRTGERTVDPETGNVSLAPPHDEKIGLLILIARVVSVIMGIAAALGLFAAVRILTGDEIAAGLGAAAFAIGPAFTYFAHLGNVDAPSMCWFTWSLYFYARLLNAGRTTDAVLLGLLGSLAICTKDATAGAYPGMAIVLLAGETSRRMREERFVPALLHACLQPKWLAGAAAFVLPYALLYNVFLDPHSYLERMRYWLAPDAETVHAAQHRYSNQVQLLIAAVWYAAGAVGWPLLAAMPASILFTLRRHSAAALAMLIPAAGHYVLVIVQIDFVYERFLFPAIALACVLVGIAGAALVRGTRIRPEVRFGLPCVIFFLTLGCATAVDLEMLTDSRYAAEQWFRANVEPPSSVGAFSHPQYLPRLHEMGYATYPVSMKRETFDVPQPEFLVLTSYNYEDFDEQQRACMTDLVTGRLGYEPVAEFQKRFLGTWSHLLSVAGWGTPIPGKISPTISIMRRIAR